MHGLADCLTMLCAQPGRFCGAEFFVQEEKGRCDLFRAPGIPQERELLMHMVNDDSQMVRFSNCVCVATVCVHASL